MIDDEAEMIRDAATRLFADHCDRHDLAAAAQGEWPAKLWSDVEEAGLTLALVSEAHGGAALPVNAGLSLIGIAAEHAAPIPFAETMVAAWLLDRAGQSVPAGPLSFAAIDGAIAGVGSSVRIVGKARRVPWAGVASVVGVIGDKAILLAQDDMAVTPDRNLANEPRDDIAIDLTTASERVFPAPVSQDDLAGLGAAIRAIQIAGGLRRATTLAVEYAQQRKQFGKALSQFQAIQQSLAVLATQAAVAGMAAVMAQDAVAEGKLFPGVAVAKARAGEAAGLGAAIAHQVHGAIGFTLEHDLQFSTKRLWSWRDEFGNETAWNLKLGQHLAALGADRLWPAITAA